MQSYLTPFQLLWFHELQIFKLLRLPIIEYEHGGTFLRMFLNFGRVLVWIHPATKLTCKKAFFVFEWQIHGGPPTSVFSKSSIIYLSPGNQFCPDIATQLTRYFSDAPEYLDEVTEDVCYVIGCVVDRKTIVKGLSLQRAQVTDCLMRFHQFGLRNWMSVQSDYLCILSRQREHA